MRNLILMILATLTLVVPVAAADVDGLLALEDWRGDPWVARN